MKIKRILCAAVLCAMSSIAVAQMAADAGRPQIDPSALSESQIGQTQVPKVLYRLAAIYKQKGDLERLVWTLQRLNVLQPNNGDLKLALATTYALQGEKSKTYDLLLTMQKSGFGYDLSGNPNFGKVSDTKVWTYIVDSLKTNMKSFGEGSVAFSFPKGDTLIESLVFDPKRKQFLAGSVREGKVYLVDKSGKLQDFIVPNAENGLWSVYAMAADDDDDALYVASTSSVYFKGFAQGDYGKAGVFKFRLSTGKLLSKYLLESDGQPRTLSSIAVGKGGQVFAADGVRNVIYHLDGSTLKPLVENPRFTSLRGLAVSGDGKTLYFADYALGVLGVDLAEGKGFELDYDPATLSLGGIDGMYWYDNTLVVIENGMTPRRVMRLKLGNDSHSIVNAMPIDVANAAFTLPTYGAVSGDKLYFVANSQKNAYGTYGTPKDDVKLEPVHVFRSNLRFAWDQPGIDTRRAAPKTQRAPPMPGPMTPPGLFSNVEGGAAPAPAH
jgi:sugar lactone lactonase YvrE